jgi:hypothetical protein
LINIVTSSGDEANPMEVTKLNHSLRRLIQSTSSSGGNGIGGTTTPSVAGEQK